MNTRPDNFELPEQCECYANTLCEACQASQPENVFTHEEYEEICRNLDEGNSYE